MAQQEKKEAQTNNGNYFEEDGEIKRTPGAIRDEKGVPIELIPELKMLEGQSLQ